jgi:hypothetical protein
LRAYPGRSSTIKFPFVPEIEARMSNEIRVQSWTELMEQLYADSWNVDLKRHRPHHAFRGQCRMDRPLIPGLMRMGSHYPSIERLLLNDFRQYAPSNLWPGNSVWNWLAVAQHHGLPTRLLDWTYSPYVALHFATSDMGAEIHVTDGVVWCIDYGETNKCLPEKLATRLDLYRKSVFSVTQLDEVVPTLDEFDNLQADAFMIFLEPPSLDDRIVNQVALFSIMSSPRGKNESESQILSMDAVLDEMEKKRAGEVVPLYKKIIIPAELKWEIRDKMDQANITERVLFPGLDGLSQWLRRHYARRID